MIDDHIFVTLLILESTNSTNIRKIRLNSIKSQLQECKFKSHSYYRSSFKAEPFIDFLNIRKGSMFPINT